MEQLTIQHEALDLGLIAAPVLGIPAVAARGELNILAAGNAQAIEQVQPVFGVLGKRTWRLGDQPRHSCIAKIACNMMISQTIEALAEASQLSELYGLNASDFIDVATQSVVACPIYQRYGPNIVNGSYEPGFKLSLGLKDVNLALEAGQVRGISLPGATVVRSKMETAMASQDWSVLATMSENIR